MDKCGGCHTQGNFDTCITCLQKEAAKAGECCLPSYLL